MKTMTYKGTCKSLILLDLLLLTRLKSHVDWKSDGNDVGEHMIAKHLIRKIRNTRGPILVEVANFQDEFWIQAVKADLIQMLQEKFHQDAETGFELVSLTGKAVFGKDYQC